MASYITGDRQVVAALNQLGGNGLTAMEIDQAAKVAMDPMLQDVKQRAQVHRNFKGKWSSFFPQPKSGRKHLDQGFAFRKTAVSKGRRSYKLGATGRARRIAHLLEFGTQNHWQPNLNGGWQHPGARRSPILTPAFNTHKDQVVMRMGQFLWDKIRARVASFNRKRSRRP